MTKQECLSTFYAARKLLAERYCKWTIYDVTSDRQCQLGCIHSCFGTAFPQHVMDAAKLVNESARRMYPDLDGIEVERRQSGIETPTGLFDSFDKSPAVFVNNHLGKDAILAVYDDVIAALEVAVLYEEETAKHAARAGLHDAVEIERYAASLRVDSIGE